MWRELILDLTRDEQPIGNLHPGPDFRPGATVAELDAVEQALGVGLPESLKSLLQESNGVWVTFGAPLIWSTDEIVRTNLSMRDPGFQKNYMPFDHLLFFGDVGIDGVRFAFPIIQGRIERDQVYAWYPILDERLWKADSLRSYVESWLSGKLRA